MSKENFILNTVKKHVKKKVTNTVKTSFQKSVDSVKDMYHDVSNAMTDKQFELFIKSHKAADQKLYQHRMKNWNTLLNDLERGKKKSKDYEGLRELLVQSYIPQEQEVLTLIMTDFMNLYGYSVHDIIMYHTEGAEDYVESKDYLYNVPEVIFIAERAINRPALLRIAMQNSDFEAVIHPMIENFQENLKKAPQKASQ